MRHPDEVLAGGDFNGAAAQYPVPLIAGDGLSGRDGQLRIIEGYRDACGTGWIPPGDHGRRRGVLLPNLGVNPEGLASWCRWFDPMHIV